MEEFITDLLKLCHKKISNKPISNDKDIDFFIKKSICLSEFKNMYIGKKIKKDRKNMREYLDKIAITLLEWVEILKNNNKCIPISSGYLVDIDKIEILNPENENNWINIGKLRKKFKKVTELNDKITEEKSPTILIDTGGFGKSLITENLRKQLKLPSKNYPIEPEPISICGGTMYSLGYTVIIFRFKNRPNKTYNLKLDIVPEMGKLFKYGIFIANDFLKKNKNFIIKLDKNDITSIREAERNLEYDSDGII